MKKCGRGSVFFVSDFISYGTRSSVNKALERMTAEGVILRVARGIYCYPKIDRFWGLGTLLPSVEDIVGAMARRDGAHVIPADAWAQYQIGITQQVPMNYVYLTDGPSRSVEVGEKCSIVLKHASPRYFTMKDPLAQMFATAFREWKVKDLDKEQVSKLKKLVAEHGSFPIEDLKLMPANVREFVQSLMK